MDNDINSYICSFQEDALKLQNAFIHKFKQNWGLKESVCELVIQLGHLSLALALKENLSYNSLQQRNRGLITNISDEVSDCLLSLFSIRFYARISPEELIESENFRNIFPDNNTEIALSLSILGPQLLDSYEIYSGLKPKFNRDERKIFVFLWTRIFKFILHVVQRQHIDVEQQFNCMLKNAYFFLDKLGDTQ